MSGSTKSSDPRWEEAQRWFAKAREDRRMAALALADNPALLDPAAYHCQQAIEKLFKGLLVVQALAVPRTHDLTRLANLLAPGFPTLSSEFRELAALSSWGTITRYPMLEADIGPESDEIMRALGQFDGLIAFVESLRN